MIYFIDYFVIVISPKWFHYSKFDILISIKTIFTTSFSPMINGRRSFIIIIVIRS